MVPLLQVIGRMTSEVDGHRLACWTMAPHFKIPEASLVERKTRAAQGAGEAREGAAPAVEGVAVVVGGAMAVTGVGLAIVGGEAHAEAARVVVTVDGAEAVLEIVVTASGVVQAVAKANLEIVVTARGVVHVHAHVRVIGLGQQNLVDSAVGLRQRLPKCLAVGTPPFLRHPEHPVVDSRRCLHLLRHLLQHQTHKMLRPTVDLQPLLLLPTYLLLLLFRQETGPLHHLLLSQPAAALTGDGKAVETRGMLSTARPVMQLTQRVGESGYLLQP